MTDYLLYTLISSTLNLFLAFIRFRNPTEVFRPFLNWWDSPRQILAGRPFQSASFQILFYLTVKRKSEESNRIFRLTGKHGLQEKKTNETWTYQTNEREINLKCTPFSVSPLADNQAKLSKCTLKLKLSFKPLNGDNLSGRLAVHIMVCFILGFSELIFPRMVNRNLLLGSQFVAASRIHHFPWAVRRAGRSKQRMAIPEECKGRSVCAKQGR